MEKVRVGIVGSRLYENKLKIKEFIFKLKQKFDGENKRVIVVSGGCKDGADKYAKKYALELDCKYLEFNPAHTQRNLYSALHDAYYGKEYSTKYFFQRNKMLVSYVDYVIAFMTDDSNGTLYTIKEAKKKGKKVVIMS